MNLKEIKQRIQSVKNTQKITSAMKLISAAKLRRAQNAIESARPYEQTMGDILSAFLADERVPETPYTVVRDIKRAVVIAVSSNSGLCGGFNANIIREAKGVIEKHRAAGAVVDIYSVGKKITAALQKAGLEVDTVLEEQASAVSYEAVASVALDLMRRYLAGEVDRVDIVYTRFISPAKQSPVQEVLLPLDLKKEGVEGGVQNIDYILEPSAEELLQQLLPKVAVLRLFTSLLDSAAAEHAARMLAMQTATDNADDLIDELVREYNKGRQQAITNELLDIVSGSIN